MSQLKRTEWALDYMTRNSFGNHPRWYDHGTIYDVGSDFCEAFVEKFPGRKPDGNLVNASKRLGTLLRNMWKHGLIDRAIQGNEKDIRNEPSWQYVYALFCGDYAKRRAALKDTAG